MNILSNITGYIKSIGQIRPINFLRNSLNTFVDKVTFGRGLKIWAKPVLREVKAKEDFSEFELANGMKVIFKQSKGTEIAASLNFDSGSTKDPKGKEGLAHFLEHMTVFHTKEFGEEISDVIKINGGGVNAMTSNVKTIYPIKLPKDKLDLALRIFRGYMSPLNFDEKDVEKEKGVICSELKIYEADPKTKIMGKFREIIFGKEHPLAQHPIGSSKSVQSVTKQDLDIYHQEHYVPNVATLTLSGDFDKAKVKTLITRYFADLKANPNSKKINYSNTLEPAKQKDHLLKDDTLSPALTYVYRIPIFNHKDTLICNLLNQALTGGDDSRLNKQLLDGEGNNGQAIATNVSVSADQNSDYGFFCIKASPLEENRDANFSKIETVINTELADIAQNGLKEKEFARLIREFENREIYKKDSQHADLGLVSNYYGNGLDWTKALDILDDIKKITNDDVKNFVQKYLIAENRHSLKTLGKGSAFNADFTQSLQDQLAPASAEHKDKTLSPEKLEHVIALSKGLSNVNTRIDDLQKFKHGNGMNVYLKEDHNLPLVLINADFPGGTLAIDENLELSLSLLDGILAETGSYNPHTLRRFNKHDIENIKINLGASFEQSSSLDSGSFSLYALSKNLDKTIAFASEVINNPALLETQNKTVVKEVEEEFFRRKSIILDGLNNLRKLPTTKAVQKFFNTMYPKGHKFYKESIDEQIARLKGVKLEDMREIYKKLYHAKDAKITAVGDITKETVMSKVIPFLDTWNKRNQNSERKVDYSRIAPVTAPKANLQIVSSDNNEPHSLVCIGNPAEVVVDAPDYYPAVIANQILGGGMSSRLFNEVREKKGLVYSIGSGLTTFQKGCGPFAIELGCDPRLAKQSIAATIGCVREFLTKGVTKEELELAKAAIKRSFALGAFNSRKASLTTLVELQMRDKDDNFVNNVNQIIDAITVDQVNEAARKFIKPNNFTIVATKPKDFVMPVDEQKPESRAKNMNMALAA